MAKFYQKDISREVIVANTFYFSSDYLDERDNNDSAPEYTMTGWDGMTSKSFAFVLRNYENPLLFNDSAQDVDYVITYKTESDEDINVSLWRYMPDDPNAVNGYVLIPEGKIETLKGGVSAYTHNDYKILIESKDPSVPIEHNVEVEIDAKTVNTEYIKQISAKVTLQYSQYASYIAKKGFIDVTEGTYGLKYNICTANEQDNSDLTNTYSKIATKTLCLTWDNENLELNRFEDRLLDYEYIYIGNDNDATNNIYTEEYIIENIKDFKNKIIINNLDGANQGYLYYDTLPFSEFNITFFKRKDVNDQVWDNLDDMVDVSILED
jgi:hypothetical protein